MLPLSPRNTNVRHRSVLEFDTKGFKKVRATKPRKPPHKPACANLLLTAFQREKVYLEFDANYPLANAVSHEGILTITNPSDETAHTVTFDHHRSDDCLDVVPGVVEISANATVQVATHQGRDISG